MAGGYKLSSGVRRWTPVWLIGGFALVWTAATIVVLLLGISQGSAFLIVFATAFAVADAILLSSLWKIWRQTAAWDQGYVILDRWPLHLGETATGWFHRTALADNSMADRVNARLVLRESATYRVGTDTRTATEDVMSVPLATQFDTRDGLEGSAFTFTIPRAGPSTIELRWNLVEWLLVFDVSEDGAPDAQSTFPVRVQAKVVAA